ncbi:SDR family NAD(P)-dependent oxidoreductase [Streptomyces sp. NPDC056237]|uniref:SDR family NAD(P)-dependent oxidoreductase n=1 Tax=unclassified Streptomyces TaxID=2593676 RepID=UPI0035D83CB5
MNDFSGQRALVTGASSGIGAAFAEQLAALGADLVLVARSGARLEELAARLRKTHGVQAAVLPADLAAPGAARRLEGDLAERGQEIDVLVNNAGFAMHGLFAEADQARVNEQVALNVAAPVELTGLLLPGMIERGRGTVVNVASTAAFQPLPHMAVYGATKAFVLSWTEALWAETRGTGVDVLALCPGATQTRFFDVVGTDAASVGRRQTPEQVVSAALRALAHRRPSTVSGRANAALASLPRIMPRTVMLRLSERSLRPRDAA